MILLLSSCGLMKNTNVETQKSRELLSQEGSLDLLDKRNLKSNSKAFSFSKATGSLDYNVQIWPKGNISFSPDKGFSGEAEKIEVKGMAKGSRMATAVLTAEQTDKSERQVSIALKDKHILQQKAIVKKSSPSWKWPLAGLILLASVGGLIYKKMMKIRWFLP